MSFYATPIVIGISGYAGSGKDTLAEAIYAHVYPRKCVFAANIWHLSDPVKQMVKELDPILTNHTKGATRYRLSDYLYGEQRKGGHVDERWLKNNTDYREYLVAMGDGIRGLDESFWVDQLMLLIDHAYSVLPDGKNNHLVLVPDIRYHNEVSSLRAAYGPRFLHIHVDAPHAQPANKEEKDSVDALPDADCVVTNKQEPLGRWDRQPVSHPHFQKVIAHALAWIDTLTQ